MGASRVGAEVEVEMMIADMRVAIAEMAIFIEEMVVHAHVLEAPEALIDQETDEIATTMSNQEKTVAMVGGQAEVQRERVPLR